MVLLSANQLISSTEDTLFDHVANERALGTQQLVMQTLKFQLPHNYREHAKTSLLKALPKWRWVNRLCWHEIRQQAQLKGPSIDLHHQGLFRQQASGSAHPSF